MKSQTITAVEGDSKAVELLKSNLSFYKIKHATVIEQDVRGFLLEHGRRQRQRVKSLRETWRKPTPQFDVVILDPPRGCVGNPIMHAADISYHVLYVSCDSDSMARDIELLYDKGWEIQKIALVDMFPQTRHFETVALLQRVPKNPFK